MRVLALDYGRARTGVAISDTTGTVARPLGVVERAATPEGLDRLVAIVQAEQPDLVVVGLPLTLRGEVGEQARETRRFIDAVASAVDVPVESFDERFTTHLAEAQRDASAPADARAAAHLLAGYLEWSSRRP